MECSDDNDVLDRRTSPVSLTDGEARSILFVKARLIKSWCYGKRFTCISFQGL